MFADLKKRSLKSAIARSIALLVLCVLVAALAGGQDLLTLVKGATTIDDISTVNRYEGEYVTLRVTASLDYYAYSTRSYTSDDIVSVEYAVTNQDSYDDLVLMGIMLPASEYPKFEEWANSGSGEYVVQGMLYRMDSQTTGFFNETLEAYGYDPVLTGRAYYIDSGMIGGTSRTQLLIVLGILLVLILFIVYTLIKALTGGYQKNVKKLIAATPFPDQTRAAVEEWYPNAQMIGKALRVGPDYFMIYLGIKPRLVPVSTIVWAYQQTTRTNGVNSGFSLMLGLTDKHILAVQMREAQVQEALQYISRNHSGIAVGHSQKLRDMFNQNPENLRYAAAEQRGIAPPAYPQAGYPQPGAPAAGYPQAGMPQQPPPYGAPPVIVPPAPAAPTATPPAENKPAESGKTDAPSIPDVPTDPPL